MPVLANIPSLFYFWPENILVLGILAIVVVGMVRKRQCRRTVGGITLGTCVLSLAATLVTADGTSRGIFGGVIARDPFSDFFKILFLVTTAVVGLVALRARDTVDYRDNDRDASEFYALTLSATLGMNLMAASTDLLMAFLSLEFVSIISYVLSGFTRGSRRSAEASLKYVIYGGVASGAMLYGMSLLYGIAGSTDLTVIRAAAAQAPALLVICAVALCMAGFGYKIAAVPFHMWCPDVYEGAPTPVTAFLSVGPKAAGFALLLRFFTGAVPAEMLAAGEQLSRSPWTLFFAAVAVATMTLGNLAALAQKNLKRLLAYSSIAHAGYLLMGVAVGTPAGRQAILFYLAVYLLMNLAAFTVVLAMAEDGVGESISDYAGLGYRAPFAAVAMSISLFSLTGLPPFAGFVGKYYLFAAVIQRGMDGGGSLFYLMAVIGVLNSAVSLYYYARIMKAMYLEKFDAAAFPVAVYPVHKAVLGVLVLPTIVLGLYWSPLISWVEGSLAVWMPAAASHAAATAALLR